ncbi:MAG TPA: Hsp20/alpha crystallin family protein [Casimicrobiaceae bacterium]|nr:Hsp20/alpha crystallin family protein [Casimicrobiaceae bacterium]
MARVQLYDPFGDSPFEDIIRGFLRPARHERDGRTQQSFRLDVAETDNGYAVRAELPGVAKEDVNVTVEGNQVTIAAQTRSETEKRDGERVLHVERHFGERFRSFTLPTEIDESVSEAKLDDGVLELKLAKKQPQAGRKLTIQ